MRILFYASIIMMLVFVLFTRFTNAGLTETELFLRFWKEYALVCLLCILSAFLFYRRV